MSRTIRRYLLLLLAVLAVCYFFYRFRNSITLEGFHWSAVAQALRSARIGLLALGVVTIYACFAVRSLRWVRFCRWLGNADFWRTYSATLTGFTCIFLLGRAGEPIRPVLIARKNSLSMAGMFGVYVLERVADIAATVVIAGLALLLFRHHETSSALAMRLVHVARSAGVLLFAVLAAMMIFLVYFRFQGGGWLGRRLHESAWRQGWRGRVVRLLEGFSEGLQGIRTAGDLGTLTGYTAVHWILVTLVYWIVIHAFPGRLSELSLGNVTLVFAFSLVGSAIQLPGVGGGAQLAAFLVFTLIFGVEKEAAATASIMLWLVSFASCSIVGLPLLFREGWSMGELRQMAQAEEKASKPELLSEAGRASSRETLR